MVLILSSATTAIVLVGIERSHGLVPPALRMKVEAILLDVVVWMEKNVA